MTNKPTPTTPKPAVVPLTPVAKASDPPTVTRRPPSPSWVNASRLKLDPRTNEFVPTDPISPE